MNVSVVVPAYNEEKFIGKCLDSLASQDVKPKEIIVVDNNSTDHTPEIASKYPNVTVVREARQGIVYARNTGYDHASGDIIARCDADSVLPADWVGSIIEIFRKHPKILAVTGTAYSYDVPEEVREPLMKIFTTAYFSGSRVMLGHEVLFGTNMALKRSAWRKVREEVCTNESHLHEDVDLAIHLARYGTILFDRDLVVSMSSRAAKGNLFELIDRLQRWPSSKLVHTKARVLYR